MKPNHDLVEALHAAYCEAAGQRFAVALTFERKSAWRRFIDHGSRCDRKGWGVAQLRAVVAYIKRRIKAGRREEESLSFSRLVGSREALGRFEEQLLLTREAHRREKDTRGRRTAPAEVRAADGTRRQLAPEELPPIDNFRPINGALDEIKARLASSTPPATAQSVK